jgi:hypothetical protein
MGPEMCVVAMSIGNSDTLQSLRTTMYPLELKTVAVNWHGVRNVENNRVSCFPVRRKSIVIA